MPVRPMAVFVQEGCCQNNGKAPHDAERPPYKAAAAHPHAANRPAVERLRHISQQGAGEKEPEELVETAALGKCTCLKQFLCPLLDDRVYGGHTPLCESDEGSAGPEGPVFVSVAVSDLLAVRISWLRRWRTAVMETRRSMNT